MSVIYSKINATSGSTDTVANWLVGLSDRFVLTEDTYDSSPVILIDDTVRIAIHIRATKFYYKTKGGSWSTLFNYDVNLDVTVEVIISDDLIYFRFKTDEAVRGCVVCYVRHDESTYIGGAALQKTTADGGVDLSAISLTDYDTGSTQNYFINLLPIASPFGTVAYISNSLISNNGSTCFTLKDTLSSTTAAFGSVMSIGPDNYYAIGTNNLIRIDEVAQ